MGGFWLSAGSALVKRGVSNAGARTKVGRCIKPGAETTIATLWQIWQVPQVLQWDWGDFFDSATSAMLLWPGQSPSAACISWPTAALSLAAADCAKPTGAAI